MPFCSNCGKAIADNVSFCPNCGASQAPQAAEVPVPVQPVVPAVPTEPVQKVTGGIRGKSIASTVLGGTGLLFGGLAWFFILIQLLFSASASYREGVMFTWMMYIYILIYGLIGLGCSIAGKILADKSLAQLNDYKVAKIGRTLSVISLLVNVSAMALGLLIALFASAGGIDFR